MRRRPSAGIAADLRRRSRGRAAERPWLAGSAADDHAGLLLPATFVGFAPRRALTRMLLVPEQIELVARRRLKRHAQVADPPGAGRRRRSRRILHVGPLSENSGVEVCEPPGNGTIAAFLADVQEVPDAILLDRTADTSRQVP